MFLTREEIGRIGMDPNDEWLWDKDSDGIEYVTILLTGLSGIGERIFGVDLHKEPYLDAWIDVYADMYPIRDDGQLEKFCPHLYFNLVANTGYRDDDRDVDIVFTNPYEMLLIYDQIASDSSELAKALNYKRNRLFE